jgi:hypothetical protein
MANLYNPNLPVALGLEWLANIPSNHIVGPSFDVFVQRLRSTAVETIGVVRARVDGNAAVSAPLYTVMDIIPAGSERPTVTRMTFLPNEDVTLGTLPDNVWLDATGSIVDGWNKINDAPVVLPIDSDGLHVRSTANAFPVVGRFRLDMSALPANARILNVSIVAVDSVTGPALASTYMGYALRNGGNVYVPPNSVFGTQVFGDQRLIDCGEINPLTQLPWSRADLASFDTPGGWELEIQGTTSASGNARSTVWKLGLQVDLVTVENRVAIATWQRPGGAIAGDVDLPVRAMPANTPNWAKPGSGVFSYLWRSALAPLLFGTSPVAQDVRWLLMSQNLGPTGIPPGAVVPPVPSMRGYRVSVDGFGIPTEAVDHASNGIGHEAAALALRTTAPATSDDSQPYFIRPGLPDLLVATNTNTVAQRIRTNTNGNYLLVRFPVVPPATGNSVLTVTVNRVSDGVQLGGAFTITAEAARALPDMPVGSAKYVQGALASVAALVSATQYELRFSSSTADGWVFVVPRSVAAGDSATYGGSADSARNGGSVLTAQDMAATLLIQPAAVTGVEATRHRIMLDPDNLCGTHFRDVVVISWASYTALGVSFSHFEVERLVDDGSDTWVPIKRVTPESRVSVVDDEPPRFRPVKYRIRPVATTAAFGEWASSGFVTAEAERNEWVLTSNAAPELSLVYNTEASDTFDMNDHEGDTPMRIAGAPYVTMFVDPEPRGVAQAVTFVVNFGRQPRDALGRPIGRKAVFEPLRRLTRAVGAPLGDDPQIPYIAVLDSEGNTTYGFVTLGRATRSMPGWVYKIPAVIVPLTDTPVVIDDSP